MKHAELIIDSVDRNADLYYASHFDAHSSKFVYFRTGGKKYLLMSDLEFDRAKKESSVDKILSLTKYMELARKKKAGPSVLDAVMIMLKERGIRRITIPDSTPFSIVDSLRKSGFKVEGRLLPFYPKRAIKNKTELREIIKNQKIIFSSMKLAENLIKKSRIKNNALHLGGKPFTSERLSHEIKSYLYSKGLIAPHGIVVSCGRDTEFPHRQGSGVLRPHQPIIIDIFPQSVKTKFWGDATRTFCKGRPSPELKRMYAAVKFAQEGAIRMVRAGVNGKKIHTWICNHFEENGFRTGEFDGQRQGFIHGTGHGTGLELHEQPVNIKPVDCRLKAGYVTSIEPGLYYKGIGGVRIEDLVFVTKKGGIVLGRYPKRLEIKI